MEPTLNLDGSEQATMDLTPNRKPANPPSDRQMQYAAKLADDLGRRGGDDLYDWASDLIFDTVADRETLSTTIDTLTERLDTIPVPEVPLGVHLLDGAYFKVQQSRTSGQKYAKEWVEIDGNEGWDYVGRKPLDRLSDKTLLDAEQASDFGHRFGICVFCSSDLTDGRSVDVGYGPTCAENNGLPWG